MGKISGWFALFIFMYFCKISDCFRMQDASIFPGLNVTGLHLPFSQLGQFANIRKTLKDEGFLKMGLFCVKRGAFILYRGAQFKTKDGKDFKIASGDNKCYNNMQGMESAQPIGPIHLPKQDSITFYNNPFFSGVCQPTAKNVGFAFFSHVRKTIKSLIMIGRQNWTMTTRNGTKHCLRVKFDPKEKFPICLLPNFKNTGTKKPGLFLRKVSKGCKEDIVGTNIIEVNNCHYWGGKVPPSKYKPLKVSGDAKELGRSDSDTMCAGDGSEEMKETLRLFTQATSNQAWAKLAQPGKSENIVWVSLMRNKDKNIVMEMTWLIANLVGGICHRLFGFVHNFWALYIHFVNQMYFIPVLPEWNQTIPNLDILLGGEMALKYNQLALFTSLSLDAAKGLEPFRRPTAKTVGK